MGKDRFIKKVVFVTGMAIFAVVLWLHLGTQTHAEGTSEREYWYSSDPGAALLVVRFMGGMTGTISRITVFADGRCEYRRTDNHGNEHSRSEFRLTTEEVAALLDRAVHAGLMEFDREEVKARMLASQPPHIVHDAPTMFLEINLERYRAPGDRDAVPASNSMSLRAISAEARIFPDIEEIQAMADIAKKLTKKLKELKQRETADHAQ
jgi:hypothetical protein